MKLREVITMNEADVNLSYPYVKTDAGRSLSKRPRQRNDCTVRSVSLALSIPYDAAYDMLCGAGRKCSQGFEFTTWMSGQAWTERVTYPAKRGVPRMNIASFCEQHRHGIYICQTARHVFTVIDGFVHDSGAERPNRCVYSSWKITLR